MKRILMTIIPAVLLAGCNTTEKIPALPLSNLDTSVAPGDDFYKYATGGWQALNPLKAEYARFGSFNVLDELNKERLNELFRNLADLKPEYGTDEQKIADLYLQGLDSLRLNSEGKAPIMDDLKEIYDIEDKAGVVKMVAKLHKYGTGPFFGTYVEADLTNSNNQILYLGQGGLGIGDRDYYTEEENSEIRSGYRTFLAKVFSLTGYDDAQSKADNALGVEQFLAENSWTKVEQRDVEASYNPMSQAELQAAYPGFDFGVYFSERGIPEQEKLCVGEPSFFEAFNKWFATADLGTVKDYLAAQLITDACNALSDDYIAASFDFYSRQMTGATEQKPRWKRAMAMPNAILGEAVGKMYVSQYFPESSKEKMLQLVNNIQETLGEHIDALEWMGAETKAKAQEKLSNFYVKIGYPDKWKDYSSLVIDPEKSYYENLKAASAWAVADNTDKLGKPTDKTEWGMSPQTVNAYYNPTTNEICFPAAILQPPFFNPDADDAVNYGAIGVVICHEMTHGFDDQGRLFDKDGNMNSWWTEEDDSCFRARAAILIDQFNKVEILPDLMANGEFTIGENIADHGGLSISFDAMKKAVAANDPGVIDGFTPEQRFYLGYAQVWAQNITDEEKARLTKIDPHSLAENRVNVSIRNFQSFFDAFGIKEGDPMFRPSEERVHIW